jgi:disulfide bond formation protein DsbB
VRRAGWLLVASSGGLLLGALGFQFIGGLAPCDMCHWQRWAHLAVIALALPAAIGGSRLLASVAILAMVVSAGLGLFHAGVEQKWWPGITACAASLPAGASASDMLDQMLGAPLVRCDSIPWSVLGLSMAAWNAALSALAALAAAIAWRRG